MNKKLQNMLEEQLTKNMHLQKVAASAGLTQELDSTCLCLQDLELLSQELVRLSKDSSPGGSTARSE